VVRENEWYGKRFIKGLRGDGEREEGFRG